MIEKQEQIEQLKKQIEVLKQQLKDKEAVLNSLLDMLYKDSDETDEAE